MNEINDLYAGMRPGASVGMDAAVTDHFVEHPGPQASGLMVWQVGALCKAVSQALDTRFNPVAVRGEISGFSRAASGHCYFSLKDEGGQIRCAMFRRAAMLLDFAPRDGELVELRGRLGVYEQRGDLQLVVESMRRAGQGTLFEQFLQLKARLEAEGLFATERKRSLPLLPRGLGVVTSLRAAALHDVLTALKRRVPHLPVLVAPAAVQGAGAAEELARALRSLYAHIRTASATETSPVDVILLVRGGGSMEDLWSFNHEGLVRTIAESPVPIVCGIGHETDFTLADFAADVRAPTPTAAAELAAPARELLLGVLDAQWGRLGDALERRMDALSQRLDRVAARLGRPSGLMGRQQQRLLAVEHRLHRALGTQLARRHHTLQSMQQAVPALFQRSLQQLRERCDRASLRLGLLDPSLVLKRGYAWLQDAEGRALTRAGQTYAGQSLTATLADGKVALTVNGHPDK